MFKEGTHIKAGKISKPELDGMREKFKKGTRVIASRVKDVKTGETGLVGEVKNNGDILVFWMNGLVNDVRYLEDEVYPIADKGCILGRRNSFENGHCEDMKSCATCGWNYEIAEKRKFMIQHGNMKVDERGIKKLVIGENGY